MKLYAHMSRFQYRRLYSTRDIRKLRWALGLKPGGLVAACTGFNVRVDRIEPCRVSTMYWCGHGGRSGRGWFIEDVLVYDTDGCQHYIRSCCWRPQTVKQITAYWSQTTDESLAESDRLGWDTGPTRVILKHIREQTAFVDVQGVLLPEVRAEMDAARARQKV